MIEIFFLIINLCFALFILFLTIAFAYGAPFVPSNTRTARAMIDAARITPGDTVYDLGSGNGKLLFLAAQKGAQAIGYEINPFLVLYTHIRVLCSPYRSQIHVYWKNFWGAKLPRANAVFVYLIPWKMDKLELQLQKTLSPKSRIVSNSFIFPHLKKLSEDKESHVYVFHV